MLNIELIFIGWNGRKNKTMKAKWLKTGKCENETIWTTLKGPCVVEMLFLQSDICFFLSDFLAFLLSVRRAKSKDRTHFFSIASQHRNRFELNGIKLNIVNWKMAKK